MTRRAEDLWRTWTHRPRVRSVARLPARAPRPGTPRGRRGTNTNRLAHAAPRRRAQEQTHSPASTVRTQPAQGLARTLEVHHPTRGQTDQQPGRTGAPRPGDVRSAAVPMRLSSSRLHLRNRPRAGAASAPARSRRLSCSGTPVASAFIAMGASGSLADFRGSTGEGPPPTPDRRLRIAGSSAARGGDRHRCDTHPKPPGRAILDLAVTRDLPDQGTHVLPDIWPRSTERKSGFCRKLFNGETGT